MKKLVMTFRLFAAALIGVLLISAPTPSDAITKDKWQKACENYLGLRANADRHNINGAGYALDNGVQPIQCFQDPPLDWDTLLSGTITYITGLLGADSNYLMMVTDCSGTAEAYPGTFKKCNKIAGVWKAATDETIGNYTDDELIHWVNNAIAAIPLPKGVSAPAPATQ